MISKDLFKKGISVYPVFSTPQFRSIDRSTIASRIALMMLFSLTLICSPLYSHMSAEAQDTETDTSTIPDYHRLSNEELLQQTQDLFDTASNTFRIHMRGLKNSALLLEDARLQ